MTSGVKFCTATMTLHGPVGLACTGRRGHTGPHRDSGWPVLWTDLLEKKRWDVDSEDDRW